MTCLLYTSLHKYQLVAGERRLRACRLAKLDKVPAILADYDDSESAALGLLENLQRSQLDPFDTARGIKEVIRLWGCTQAEAARRLGLSQPALANKLRLLTLTPKINLGLNIVSKRKDGYHNLETVFYPIPLTDALEIKLMGDEFPSDVPVSYTHLVFSLPSELVALQVTVLVSLKFMSSPIVKVAASPGVKSTLS